MEPIREIVTARYWNNGTTMPVAVVAVKGHVNDVGAYIGAGYSMEESSEDAMQYVARHGSKLTESEAMAFMPELATCGLRYRR